MDPTLVNLDDLYGVATLRQESVCRLTWRQSSWPVRAYWAVREAVPELLAWWGIFFALALV